MKPRALGGHTATFETKGVAGNTPSISATEERNAATAGPRAAFVDALEASFPGAEIHAALTAHGLTKGQFRIGGKRSRYYCPDGTTQADAEAHFAPEPAY